MTIVVAYADTPPGHAALAAAVAESSRERETLVLVPAVRGDKAPEVGEIETRWPDIAGRVEVERGIRRAEHGTVGRDLAPHEGAVGRLTQQGGIRLIEVRLVRREPLRRGTLAVDARARRLGVARVVGARRQRLTDLVEDTGVRGEQRVGWRRCRGAHPSMLARCRAAVCRPLPPAGA